MVHRRKKRRSTPDPEQVLRGHCEVDIEQLFGLIHRINPTGKVHSAVDRGRAYNLKSRLQSLLIERHADALEIETTDEGRREGENWETPDHGDEIVGIRHRHNRRDACHVRMRELSDRARSWVRLQLDTRSVAENSGTPAGPYRSKSGSSPDSPGDPPAPAPLDVVPDSVAESIRLSQAAIEEYDYDRAQTLLAASIKASCTCAAQDDNQHAARALLPLLVDHLFANREALEFRRYMLPATLEDTAVRGLLALAAARESEDEMAKRLIVGLAVDRADADRADEVRLELARHALDRGDLQGCEAFIHEIAPSGDFGSDAQVLAHALAAKRSDLARPIQAELAAALVAEAWPRTKEIALRLIGVEPGNKEASAALRKLAQREREAEVETLLASVCRSLEAGDLVAAARHLRAAEALGAQRPDLEARITEASARQADQTKAATLDSLLAHFGGGMTAAGIEAYWKADATCRSALRERVALRQQAVLRELEWIERFGPAKGDSQCQAAVTAAHALVHTEEELDHGNVQAAQDSLAEHEAHARSCAEGRQLLERIHQEISSLRHEQAALRLAEAESRAAADPQRAEAVVAGIPIKILAEPERRRLEALRQRLHRVAIAAEHRQRFAEFEQAADILAAKAEAECLVELTEGEEAVKWNAIVSELRHQVAADWIRETFSGIEVSSQLQDAIPSRSLEHGARWMLPGSRQIVLATSADHWLFVRLVDLVDPDKSRAVAIKTPTPMAELKICVERETVWFIGEEGCALQMRIDPWDVLQWIDTARVEGLPLDQNSWTLVPGSTYIWAQDDRIEGEDLTYVFDVRRRIVERKLDGYLYPCPILGTEPPRIVLADRLDQPQIFDAQGRRERREALPEGRFDAAALHPNRQGYLVMGSVMDDEGCSVHVREYLMGRWGFQLDIPECDGDFKRCLSTSLDVECSYLVCGLGEQRSLLLAIAVNGGQLREMYRMELDDYPLVVTDPDCRRVSILQIDDSGIEVIPLGPEPPRLHLESRNRCSPLAWIGAVSSCSYHGPSHRAASESLGAEIMMSSTPDETVRALARRHAGDAEMMLALLDAEEHRFGSDHHEEIEHVLFDRHTDHPRVRLMRAEAAVHDHEFHEVFSILDDAVVASTQGPLLQHTHHLRGLSLLELGNERGAQNEIQRALECNSGTDTGTCDLGDLAELTSALCDPALEAPEDGPEDGMVKPSIINSAIHTLRAAESDLARGDFEAMIERLDRTILWRLECSQFLARLTLAYLGVNRDDSPFLFRKRLVLAAYLETRPYNLLRQPPLGSLTWPSEVLIPLRQRAQAWLEESG